MEVIPLCVCTWSRKRIDGGELNLALDDLHYTLFAKFKGHLFLNLLLDTLTTIIVIHLIENIIKVNAIEYK
jgi:hypothetical protein